MSAMPPAKGSDVETIANRIEAMLKQPVFFAQIMEGLEDCAYRSILLAWGEVRRRNELQRDQQGRYWVKAL